MSESNHHDMKLGQTYPSGAQEWICPICGRWIVMHHLSEQGKLKTIVLQTGDEEASHAGSSGSVKVSTVQVTEQSEATLPVPTGTQLH
jgi:hypothetical protein